MKASRVESLSEKEKKKMKKPIPKIRVFGQRSIASSFLNPSSIPVEASSSNQSDKSVLLKPNNIEEGIRSPFTSFDCSKDLTKLSHRFGEEKKKDDGGLEKMMLQQFKPREIQISEEVSREIAVEASLDPVDQIPAEETDNLASYFDETNEDIIIVKDDKTSKKRKDPFEGMESMSRTGKSVIVFGDNSKVSKPMQRERERGSNNNSKKQRSTYNHYANGSGWWDCDMEGVDSEEVGHSEVWEGVGSTTFGDIVDWH